METNSKVSSDDEVIDGLREAQQQSMNSRTSDLQGSQNEGTQASISNTNQATSAQARTLKPIYQDFVLFPDDDNTIQELDLFQAL